MHDRSNHHERPGGSANPAKMGALALVGPGFCYNPRRQAMDFDHLVTFLEIAKQGSFSRAGQKLYRSQDRKSVV